MQLHLELWHLGVITDDLIGWTNVNLKAGDFNPQGLCAFDLPLLDEKTNKLASGVLRVTIRMDNVPRMAPEVPEVDEVAAMIEKSTAEVAAASAANGNGADHKSDVKSTPPLAAASASVMVTTDLPPTPTPAPAPAAPAPAPVTPPPAVEAEAPAPAVTPAPAVEAEAAAPAPTVESTPAPAADAPAADAMNAAQ